MTALTVQEFGSKLNKMDEQFKSALPEHISVERFKRTAMTALQQDSELLNCQVKSVLTALTLCAADGLLPNRREAALIIFNNRKAGTKEAQYMPMIAGVRKRMYNSGEIESIDAQVVRENDDFDYELGDNPRIIHKPSLDDRGDLRLAYCVVRFKDGGIHREIMTKDEIYKARDCSKAKNFGPWKDWESEMWRKTVLHRAAKAVPVSSDAEKFLRQDMTRILGENEEAKEMKNITPAEIVVDQTEDEVANSIMHVADKVDTSTGEIKEAATSN